MLTLCQVFNILMSRYSPQRVRIEFFGYIITTNWVFERQIKFVIIVQHLEALGSIHTGEISTPAVHVNINVFREFFGITRTIIVRLTVWNEPCDFLSFSLRMIVFFSAWRWSFSQKISIDPRYITVPTVVHRPVNYVGIVYEWAARRRFRVF